MACGSKKKCITLAASDLQHDIIFQSRSRTQDEYGSETETYTTVATAYAKIEPKKAFEKMQMMQLTTPITHKISVRYVAGINTQCRILFGSRIFNILEVINVEEKNITLEIMASENAGT